MKDTYENDDLSQQEALLNEFKGNLFEYLFASTLARHYGIEGAFLRDFQGPLKERLLSYDQWLRRHRPELLKKLPRLAEKTLDSLNQSSQKDLILPPGIQHIYVMGKLAASSSRGKDFHEADLMLVGEEERIPLSLKLCRHNAYVNTKSGGVYSFLTRYFSSFSEAQKAQERVNESLEKSYTSMACDLYEMAGLESDEWSGKFGPEWDEKELPRLPGQLPKPMRERVVASYRPVIESIQRELYNFYCTDQEEFLRCLFPLLGLGDLNLRQITCFHGKESGPSSYSFAGASFMEVKTLRKELEGLSFSMERGQVSSFEMILPSYRLQVRVKPMNQFTTPGFKINCSLKHQSVIQEEAQA